MRLISGSASHDTVSGSGRGVCGGGVCRESLMRSLSNGIYFDVSLFIAHLCCRPRPRVALTQQPLCSQTPLPSRPAACFLQLRLCDTPSSEPRTCLVPPSSSTAFALRFLSRLTLSSHLCVTSVRTVISSCLNTASFFFFVGLSVRLGLFGSSNCRTPSVCPCRAAI